MEAAVSDKIDRGISQFIGNEKIKKQII